ncbi:MAG: hypothetical protein GXY26_04750 [Clostridiales bacterium]|mgnify:CR=1 FL=1|nr:hypothetical protein [Clostridiales bacterium]
MCRRKECCVSIVLLLFIGLVLGVANVLIWYFGNILYVREMLPFALAFAIVLFITTSILRVKYGLCESIVAEKCHTLFSCNSLRKYSPVILITAAIFIIFSMVVLATYLSLTMRVILAFTGAVSFWIMLPSFITMVLCVSRK